MAAWCMSTRLEGSMMVLAFFLSLVLTKSAKYLPS